jgi:DNA repair protein SbcD/Mre11
MRILFITDSHIRGNNPCSRKDDYAVSLREKHLEIGQIIKEQGIDVVIHGGDVFHSPDASKSLISEYIKIFRSWEVPIWTVTGSHDAIAYNEHTLPRTALGVLIAADVVHPLESIPTELSPNILAVGINHSYRLDEDPQNYSLEKNDKNSILIEVVHGMVVDKPFFDEYTLIKDIRTEADLVLCGHFHVGWEPQRMSGTLFINPGSLGRVENTERVFPPSVVILDIEGKDIDYQIVPLKCAKPSESVFRNAVKLGNETSERILDFMRVLSKRTEDLEEQDLKGLILRLAKEENVNDEVINEALTLVDEIKNKMED